MSIAPRNPSAAEVTVAEVFGYLDGPHATVAREVANGRYVFWLGSGISRGRVAGLEGVIQHVLEFLREKAAAEGGGSPHLRALEEALDLAGLRDEERARIDISKPVASWRDLPVLVSGLVSKYANLLDVGVQGQPADYLLWEAVDVRAAYPRDASPDCEHLAIAVLALEGVVTEAPTANWDGLIEAALRELAPPAATVQVVVLEQDLQGVPGILRLIKFHGCAIRAAEDPALYRAGLIARASQISDWAGSNEAAAIRGELVSLATTKRTLMIGLSGQDENIKAVFSQARARMRWRWPTQPPAHVFSGDGLGIDHRSILKIVYREDYDGNEAAIEESALIRAYGAQLLIALVLQVAEAKLCALLSACVAPGLVEADRHALAEGVRSVRDLAATQSEPDRMAFIRALIACQTRALALFRTGVDPAPLGASPFQPIGNLPVDRIAIDQGLATSGMRELAAAIGLLGRMTRTGAWGLDLTPTVTGVRGALRVFTGRGETAVFFAANPRVGITLESSAAPVASDDVVVIHSTGPVPRLPRSPHSHFGRTGRVGSRQVDMSQLLSEAKSVADLEQRFRLEVGL